MSTELKSVIMIEGVDRVFANKTEANEYLRRPKIKEALMALTDGNEEFTDWLVENNATIKDAMGAGAIRRVTKSDHKKIDAAFEAMAASGEKAYAWLIENREEIEVKYRPQPRLNDEQKISVA